MSRSQFFLKHVAEPNIWTINWYQVNFQGTGCNAAYLEYLENVDKWEGEKQEPKQVRTENVTPFLLCVTWDWKAARKKISAVWISAFQVVIDIEWGAFGDNGSLDFSKSEFDSIIDQHSNHKGSFTFVSVVVFTWNSLKGFFLSQQIRLCTSIIPGTRSYLVGITLATWPDSFC